VATLSDWLTVSGQLLLGVVFTSAAAGKLVLADGADGNHSVGDRGLTTALLVPLELGVALAVVMAPSARWGAVAALGLLLAFTVVVGHRLARGVRQPCGCFGAASRSVTGPRVVVRNVALGGAALLIAILGTPSESLVTQGLLGVSVVAVTQTWLIVELKRGSPVQAAARDASTVELATNRRAAPSFVVTDVLGGSVSLQRALGAGGSVVLVFVDPRCAPCVRLLPAIAACQDDARMGRRCIVVSEDRAASLVMHASYGLGTVAVQDDFAVARAYGVGGTPAAAIIDGDGTLRDVALGETRVRAALRELGGGESAFADEHPVKLADEAPLGRDRLGRPTLVIAWSADAVDADLVVTRALEHRTPGVRVLVVTSEPPPPSWAHLAVHDPDCRSLRHLGIERAPAAVVVDAAGQPVTKPAAGVAAALQLIDATRRVESQGGLVAASAR
jgi:AhpC/TSA family/Methylamine utilisation protein MauE